MPATRPSVLACLPLVLVLSLPGCKMIDQTFFAPDPEPSAANPIVPNPAPVPQADRTPVLGIRYDTPTPAYRDALAQAVRAVEQRRPGAIYDVIATSNATDAAQAGRDAAEVMAAMKELGVPTNRLNLGARLAPAMTTREVRIYLR